MICKYSVLFQFVEKILLPTPRLVLFFTVLIFTFSSILLPTGVIKYTLNTIFLLLSIFKTDNIAINTTTAPLEFDSFDDLLPLADGTSCDKLQLCKLAVSYRENYMLSEREAALKAGIPRSTLKRHLE